MQQYDNFQSKNKTKKCKVDVLVEIHNARRPVDEQYHTLVIGESLQQSYGSEFDQCFQRGYVIELSTTQASEEDMGYVLRNASHFSLMASLLMIINIWFSMPVSVQMSQDLNTRYSIVEGHGVQRPCYTTNSSFFSTTMIFYSNLSIFMIYFGLSMSSLGGQLPFRMPFFLELCIVMCFTNRFIDY